jgi:hypothetical protein
MDLVANVINEFDVVVLLASQHAESRLTPKH